MHLPALLLGSLVFFALALDAGVATAQEAARAEQPEASAVQPDSEAEGESKPGAAASPRPSGTTKGIEEIVIQASESEAAADFEAGDSVSAFDASDLEALGAQSVEDLAAFTPNLEIVTAGSTTPTFFIRGVGLNDFNPNSAGAVAVYQNDVPLNAPALQLGTLFDVENVNILRGPQGAGPFRNASAGAIKIYSRKPRGDYNAYLSSSFGNYGAMDFEGAVEAPIYEDILAARFAFRYTDRDGYGKNSCGGAPPTEERGLRPNPVYDVYQGDELLVPKQTFSSAYDPQWSQCGEYVDFTSVLSDPAYPGKPQLATPGVSPIPAGLPTRVNDLGNWAARGTFLFQPTLDMEWLLTVQGSRRDELSRLGQAYGTGFVPFDQDCLVALEAEATEAAAKKYPDTTSWFYRRERQRYFLQNNYRCAGRGLLGGKDTAGYQQPEVPRRWAELDRCTTYDPVLKNPQPNGTCVMEGAQPGRMVPDQIEALLSGNAAKLVTAEEIAADLDSEPYNGGYDRVGSTTNDVWGISLKGDVVLGESVYFTTVSSYNTYDREIDIDLDFTPNQVFEFDTVDDGWQVTQDLRFSGQLSEEIPVRWELGAYYLMEELNVRAENFFDPDLNFLVKARDYTQKLWSTAGYLSLEWDFWDDFTLDGGIRYNWEQKQMGFVLERTNKDDLLDDENRIWQDPSGTIRLTYRFREDTHAYFKYNRGWKGGHFNATGSIYSLITTAEPETIDSFEGGLRGSWFDGRLGANFAAFHYDYKNYQIFTAQQQLGTPPEFVVINASSAEVYGAELDLVARPIPGMYLEGRFSWLHSQFIDFVQQQQECLAKGLECVVITRQIQNTGNPLLNSPRYKISLTAEQTLPLGRFGSLTLRYDGAWTDDTNYDATNSQGIPNASGDQFLPKNTIGQRAFWLHNLRLGYRTPGGNIEVAGWVRNLTDQVYKTFGFDGSTFQQETIYFVGEPRTYGLTVTATF